MSSSGVSQSGMRGCLPATSAPVPNLTHFQNRCLFRHRAPSTRHGATQSGRDQLTVSTFYIAVHLVVIAVCLPWPVRCKVRPSALGYPSVSNNKMTPSRPIIRLNCPLTCLVTGWPNLGNPPMPGACTALQGDGADQPASYEASIPPLEAVVRSVPSCTCMPWYAVGHHGISCLCLLSHQQQGRAPPPSPLAGQ